MIVNLILQNYNYISFPNTNLRECKILMDKALNA